jgi:UDP-glucuronate 4-epimerase
MNLKMQDNKTVLITGGAGFIGSHTCESLLNREYNVISVDNFNDYYSSEYKRENIECIKNAAASANNRFKS